MTKRTEIKQTQNAYLETLEQVKKQYQQYIKVSKLYDLPTQKKGEITQYQSPSFEHPLTTNSTK